MTKRQKCHVPWARVLLPWGRQQLRASFEYKRAQVTNDGHHRRCISTEQGTENGFSEVVRVLVVQVVQVSYLDKENQELLWTAVNVLNYAISILKKKWIAVERRTLYQSQCLIIKLSLYIVMQLIPSQVTYTQSPSWNSDYVTFRTWYDRYPSRLCTKCCISCLKKGTTKTWSQHRKKLRDTSIYQISRQLDT